MERFDVRNGEWGFAKVTPDKYGAFCYAVHALRYKKRFHLSAVCNVLLVVACAVLSGYLSYHKHDPQPVAKPEVSAEEYQQAVQLAERKEAEKATLRKQLADEHARRLLGDKMLQASNANNAKLVKQLEALQVSVPAQPIVLEAIRKETATPQGFRQAVARSFGGEIAGRVRVVE